MKNVIRNYKKMSFEQKTLLKTTVGIGCSATLACGKLIIGLFTDYNLCSIAVYTLAILFAKLECVLGAKTNKPTFQRRNYLIATFLFISSLVYIGFICRMFFIKRTVREYNLIYVVLIAFISFLELGFAIAGLIRTKHKEHFYRAIKIINFGMALIAILTTQTMILDYNATANTDRFNAYTGIGVGILIAVCAAYILFAPKLSVSGREHNVFILTDADKNALVNMENRTLELLLTRSFVYGSYVYRAAITQKRKVEGSIERAQSLWKRMHISFKILCWILSEILIFVWLTGRLIFFLRSLNLPKRLQRKMERNGFLKIEEGKTAVR